MKTLLISNLVQVVTRYAGGVVCPVRSLGIAGTADEVFVFEPHSDELADAVAKLLRPGGKVVWER